MERKSHDTASNSFDTSSEEGDDSTNKKTKKKSVAGAALARISAVEAEAKKQKVEHDLAKSLDHLPLFEAPKDDKKAENNTEADTTESEAPLETLSETETEHLTKQIAEEHRDAIEHVDEQTAEQLAPAAEFLDLVAEGQDTEEAFRTVAAELGLNEAEIAEALEFDEDVLESETADIEAVDIDTEIPDESAGEFDTSDDAEGEFSLGGGSSGTGGTPPPRAPAAGGFAFGGGGAPTPAAAPAPVAVANKMPSSANEYYQRRNNAGQLLLIGMIGYVIGRRRGRLRTERKLLPVQRKLEKQVNQLEQDITQKEQQLVTLKAARQPERPRLSSPQERTQVSGQETRLHLQKPVRAERLGHMVIAAEAPTKIVEKTVEKTRLEKPNSIRQAFRPEEVKDMRRADLLELSEKITVEGASLRSIYESRLIGEKQLRHLVTEYLQGKDIRKDLRTEMVEREIDFERDPILRDRVRTLMSSEGGGQGLGELLQKAGITNDESDPTIEKRVEKAERQAVEDQKRRRKQRIVVDTSMATVITVLAVIVAILVLGR